MQFEPPWMNDGVERVLIDPSSRYSISENHKGGPLTKSYMILNLYA